MKPAPRDISLVERQIAIATRYNKPRVLAKLQKEFEELKSHPKAIQEPVKSKKMEDTLDNHAAFLFYNSK